jgi:hypothetical protein
MEKLSCEESRGVEFREKGFASQELLESVPSRHLLISYHSGIPLPRSFELNRLRVRQAQIFDEKGLIGKILIPVELRGEIFDYSARF